MHTYATGRNDRGTEMRLAKALREADHTGTGGSPAGVLDLNDFLCLYTTVVRCVIWVLAARDGPISPTKRDDRARTRVMRVMPWM